MNTTVLDHNIQRKSCTQIFFKSLLTQAASHKKKYFQAGSSCTALLEQFLKYYNVSAQVTKKSSIFKVFTAMGYTWEFA